MVGEGGDRGSYYAFLTSAPMVSWTVPEALLPVVKAPWVEIGASWICWGGKRVSGWVL